MSKGDLIQLDSSTELMKISNNKYRYVNSTFQKPSAKLSDHSANIKLKVGESFFSTPAAAMTVCVWYWCWY